MPVCSLQMAGSELARGDPRHSCFHPAGGCGVQGALCSHQAARRCDPAELKGHAGPAKSLLGTDLTVLRSSDVPSCFSSHESIAVSSPDTGTLQDTGTLRYSAVFEVRW